MEGTHWQGLRNADANRPLRAVCSWLQLVALQQQRGRCPPPIALDLLEAPQEAQVQVPA